MNTSINIFELKDACREAFNRLRNDLPSNIAQRLVANRMALRHGTDARIFEFQIRDKFQPGLLDKKHFSYGVIYDPQCRYHKWKQRMGGPCTLNVRWYANRHRIYDKAGSVIPALWAECQKAEKKLHDFTAYENDQIIGLFRFFEGSSKREIVDEICNAFLELMPYWHSRYAAVIDVYGKRMNREKVRAVIAGRQKFQPSGPRFAKLTYEYSRHVPLWLREQVFVRDKMRCLKCGNSSQLEADHIKPAAKGGLTRIENLQTLCKLCNLSKSSRSSIDYRT